MAHLDNFVVQGTSSAKLLELLLGFRRTKKFCDITLASGERNFYAHSCVLAAVSPYFLGFLRSGMSEVKTSSMRIDIAFLFVAPSAVNSVLDFIYGEDITVSPENVFDLLVLADYLLLADLKNHLCRYLREDILHNFDKDISGNMCFTTRRYAEMFGCKELYEYSDRLIKQRFYQLSQKQSFCDLSFKELETLLASDELFASDSEVLDSIVRWINQAPETRKKFIGQLFQYLKPDGLSDEYVQHVLVDNNLADNFASFKAMAQSHSLASGVNHLARGCQGQQSVLLFGCKMLLSLYQPLHQEWCKIMPMPKSRRGFKVVELNGLIYAVGGLLNNQLTLSVLCYNPESHVWSEVSPMLKTASSFGVATLGGHLYAIGGPSLEHNVQRYNPITNSWCFVKPMCVHREDHCVVGLQNKYLFAIGGFTPSTETLYSVEKYDVEANTWTDVAELNIGRIESCATALNDKIFVVGGYGGSRQHAINICEVYHSLTDQWCILPSTSFPRRGVGITVVAGEIYVFGGNPGKKVEVECYSEETKSWRWVDTLPVEHVGYKPQCCTVALSGRAFCNLSQLLQNAQNIDVHRLLGFQNDGS